jgi:hypothetical protein
MDARGCPAAPATSAARPPGRSWQPLGHRQSPGLLRTAAAWPVERSDPRQRAPSPVTVDWHYRLMSRAGCTPTAFPSARRQRPARCWCIRMSPICASAGRPAARTPASCGANYGTRASLAAPRRCGGRGGTVWASRSSGRMGEPPAPLSSAYRVNGEKAGGITGKAMTDSRHRAPARPGRFQTADRVAGHNRGSTRSSINTCYRDC